MMRPDHFLILDNLSGVMQKVRVVLGILLFLMLKSCNDFFPTTGEPVTVTTRKTPQGVIRQLMRSYTNRRIDLFEDLLPVTGTFRFYISPSFAEVYSTRSGVTYEPEIDRYYYVRGFNYYYWGQNEELSRHRNLFRQADKIEFIEPITIQETRYTVKQCSSLVSDTINAEILVTTGELVISLGEDTYRTSIDKQVFYLERDHQGLWVIRDWFDLSSN
ncbi:hypothetical protein QA601_08200 [Chitinispirillales bacterium ANBcel5]|uniref:hypothetical protein n=1 Tax=Cellulosispirillum alkaliphilum TaxID=3039283 RepID=UPI002A55474D|nr:hypothetical protein [Chitinispirillales bacterium ANBcel5]